MGDYGRDRAMSDPYTPEVMKIVGPLLLTEAPHEADVHQATDLVVITANPVRIACRVRRPGYLARYPWDVTIRYHRDSGSETEYSKIRQGWCDWAFYGHAARGSDAKLARWYLYDLDLWRMYFADTEDPAENRYGIRCGTASNADGTHFAWFDVRTFPPEPPILIASSCEVPNIETTDCSFHDWLWTTTLQAGPPPR